MTSLSTSCHAEVPLSTAYCSDETMTTAGVAIEAEEKQVSTLLYCMGEAADNTLTSTHITTDERKQYQAVIAKLDGFFQV